MMNEIRNLLIKRYGMAIILTFLIVKIITFSFSYLIQEAVFLFTPDTSAYEKYISYYEGPYNDEKGEKIESLISSSKAAAQMIGTAYVELKAENISYDEFCMVADKYSTLAEENEKGMSSLNEQLEYVSDNPEHRYLLDTRGWICLLKNDSLDLLLILMILMLSAPTFTTEYSTDMYQLLLTSKLGRKCLARRKCICTICICGLMSLIFSAAEFLTVAVKMGLPCPTAPLQSIQNLSDSPYNISLLSAFVFIALCKAIGSMLLSSIVMLLSTAVKRILPVVSIGVTAVLIPYIIIPNRFDQMYVLPLGILNTCGYLRSNETSIIDENVITIFKGVPIFMTMSLLILSLLLIILFCTCASKLYVTGNIFGRRKKQCEKYSVSLP